MYNKSMKKFLKKLFIVLLGVIFTVFPLSACASSWQIIDTVRFNSDVYIAVKGNEIKDKNEDIKRQENEIKEKNDNIDKLESAIKEKQNIIEKKEEEIKEKNEEIEKLNREIEEMKMEQSMNQSENSNKIIENKNLKKKNIQRETDQGCEWGTVQAFYEKTVLVLYLQQLQLCPTL